MRLLWHFGRTFLPARCRLCHLLRLLLRLAELLLWGLLGPVLLGSLLKVAIGGRLLWILVTVAMAVVPAASQYTIGFAARQLAGRGRDSCRAASVGLGHLLRLLGGIARVRLIGHLALKLQLALLRAQNLDVYLVRRVEKSYIYQKSIESSSTYPYYRSGCRATGRCWLGRGSCA